ncbi:MAG: hypothetical protein ABIB71_00830 [Candidatus Woesearchaeota archaeon]
MNLKRLGILASVLAFSYSNSCSAQKPEASSPNGKGMHADKQASYVEEQDIEDAAEKYALIVIGDTQGFRLKDAIKPLDERFVNSIWLDAPYVYTSLKELGFKKENIRVLVPEAKPDFDDPQMAAALQELKEEQFDGKYDNLARKANIIDAISHFDIDENDTFVLAISSHLNGWSGGISLSADCDDLYADEIDSLLDITVPEKGLFFLDICGSGKFISGLSLEDYVVVASTKGDKNGWTDRNFSNIRYFFQNLADMRADKNFDGKVSIKESFYKTRKDARAHMKSIDSFLIEYFGGAANKKNEMKDYSIMMKMVVGENSSGDMWLSDWAYPFEWKYSEK